MTDRKGVFITLEGGEGTGKSTQLKLLSQTLTEAGIANITTKEPGGTEIGQELRRPLPKLYFITPTAAFI